MKIANQNHVQILVGFLLVLLSFGLFVGKIILDQYYKGTPSIGKKHKVSN